MHASTTILLLRLGDLRDDFLYDFVAYSTRDQKWIMAKLVDHVERKNNNKFCLHDRVIIPDVVHVEDVLESIKFSPRFYFLKTIIMLITNGIFMFEKISAWFTGKCYLKYDCKIIS